MTATVSSLESVKAPLATTRSLGPVRLGHFIAPQAPANKGFYTTGEHDTRFQVVSPAETGMTKAELERYFRDDMKRKAKSFRHPGLYPSRGALWSSVPLYTDLAIEGVFNNQRGVETSDPAGGQYCVLAQAEDGGIAGFVEASFSVVDWHEDDDESRDDGDELRLCFYIRLGRAYTCARYRGKGAFSYLADAFADAYQSELEYLSKQVFMPSVNACKRVRVSPMVSADLYSRSGHLAAHIFCDNLEVVADTLREEGLAPNLDIDRLEREIGF